MKRLCTTEPGFEPLFIALLEQARETAARVDAAVAEIIAQVRARGDAALITLTAQYDKASLASEGLAVGKEEIAAAERSISPTVCAALDTAAARIETFHRAQFPADLRLADSA